MPNERLLERIRRMEEDPEHRGEISPQRIISSVLAHLQKLLNTRQGCALISPEYGVPDFSELITECSYETLEDFSRSIEKVIRTYEPRLQQVEVTGDQQDEVSLVLKFRVYATLVLADKRRVPVMFETLVDPRGNIKVK